MKILEIILGGKKAILNTFQISHNLDRYTITCKIRSCALTLDSAMLAKKITFILDDHQTVIVPIEIIDFSIVDYVLIIKYIDLKYKRTLIERMS